ncbi:SH3 domain-containing protein [Terrisporobacter glycolicus]|uniref:SH3b domain-containing protein n=1 Tax=Terrisporobacter glycolicus ATCC 14880 = DSM 1288 TaxID=1121315 RepID=A0ABZ2ET03_9FIRM|nr:SH3 domain-containing protein [Terrisporobacter glycolicus]
MIITMLTIMNIFNLTINKSYAGTNNLYSTEYIKNQEAQFICNNYFGSSEKDYEYKKGSIPILISAPHTVKQWRNESYKSADIYTGALAKTLHESTGAHIIYKASTNGDENYTTEETEYRKKIKDIVSKNDIKVIIDLHGMTSDKDSDIDIGTGNSSNINLLGQDYILSLAGSSLGNNNYTVNKYFTGGKTHTISAYCGSKLGVPTLQLEINKKYRTSDSEEFSYMANKLTDMINDLSNKVCIPKGKMVNFNKSLNLRSSMSTANGTNIIDQISLGTSVEILDNVENGNISKEWIRIKYNNKVGYVKSNYIILYNVGKIINVNKNIRLRKSVDTKSDTVCIIPKGSYVTILDNGERCKVKYNNKEGCISKKYLEVIYSHSVGKIVNVNKNIRLRKNVDPKSDTVIRIPKGYYVTILNNGERCKVKYNNKEGYISKKYLAVIY